ncbi:hypothetical protein QYE76_040072 [Lolium multiflorum]|uniref:Uncharacterized protein n=1 Tax=Lolium multiflorum TaxID=4521 RepID=A0AAD8TAW7_LOLMU|nr:hypothetical protein QYE76_040072 [Lolium multiflorum]
MARAHPMWLYSGPKDETRINAAELSEKSYLTKFGASLTSQKTRFLSYLLIPFDVDHPPTEVYPVPSFVDDSLSTLPESDRLQRMRDRVAQMEKDMRNTYALAAIVNKKNELAADTERYALTELHKAAESLNFIG